MKVIVIGASGMLGKPVTHALIKAGFTVSVAGRNMDNLKKTFPSANTIYADVFDRNSLDKAFEGQDTIYINLSVAQTSKEKMPQPEREGMSNIIAAAKSSGITRLVYLSSLAQRYQGMNSFHWWAFELKQKAVEAIKRSGIPYTIFYPSSFMETFPGQMIKGRKLMLVSGSVMKNWFIAANDYAQQVVSSLKLLKQENREYAIQGPEAYTWDEAAAILIANHPSQLKPMKAPIGLLKFLGKFSQKINYGAKIMETLNNYPEKFESDLTWKELGAPATTIAMYAKTL